VSQTCGKLLVAGHLKMPLESYCLVYANLNYSNLTTIVSYVCWVGGWENEKVKFYVKLFCYYNIQKGKKILNMFSVYMVEHLIYIFFCWLVNGKMLFLFDIVVLLFRLESECCL